MVIWCINVIAFQDFDNASATSPAVKESLPAVTALAELDLKFVRLTKFNKGAAGL